MRLPALLLICAALGCSNSKGAAVGDESDVVSNDDAAPLMTVDAMIARAKTRPYWPTGDDDWRSISSDAQATLMKSAACADFAATLFPPSDADAKTAKALGTEVDKLKPEQQALRSDGVIVIWKGFVQYENYVGSYAGHPEKRHCMWSATKSFTSGVMGAIAQASEETRDGNAKPAGKVLASGDAIGLLTHLKDFADTQKMGDDPRLGDLTIEDLLAMNVPDPVWNEGYDGNISTSNVVKMLWIDGPKDMASLAAKSIMGNSGKPAAFRYSSGNAVLLLRALKDFYGADYDRLPWTVLFDRLGMKSTVLERDQAGTFVGSSYAHMTLRDMARFGYAYLNGGFYAGEQVIHPDFIDKARVIGAGVRAPGTKGDDILEEGGFYSTGWWVNPSPALLRQQGLLQSFDPSFPQTKDNGLKPGQKMMPNTPVDMFFAAGHYGQNILIFPKDDLMVVRMSHDNEYFSKLDAIGSKARKCFLGGGT
jgi:CubicO group peptidase (beta-lactamase class C family)